MKREQQDQDLERLLREHLAAELDGQLGRSRRAFEQHLAHTRTAAPSLTASRPAAQKTWLLAAAVGTAVAASLAALWAVPIVRTSHPVPVVGTAAPMTNSLPATQTAEPPSRWQQVEQVTRSISLDRGVVIIDDHTPARLIRRVATERTQWVDPQRGVSIEAIVPRENVSLISLDTY